MIVDEFTGRLMPGRRWSDGLHQAVEAKEGVKIESENQTLATITFQNYFRMYKKLAGMTGTADTEAVEFKEIYSLDVMVVPTNQPMIRIDNHDVDLQDRGRKVRRGDRGDPGLPRARAAGAGRHGLDRKVRAGRQPAQEDRHQTLRAQRQEPRARGRDRRAGRPLRRGHDFDQHGRPRHRYRARRQSRVHGRGRGRHARPDRSRTFSAALEKYRAAMRRPSASRCSRPAACTSSAPSATSRGASTTSCAAVRDARAIPARRDFSSRSRTTCCASSAPTGSRA